jgi:zinc transporter 1/2/3
MAILNCFSIGTFLYICFFEILAPERAAKHPKLLQWVACVLGFAAMAGFLALAGEQHEHKGHNE